MGCLLQIADNGKATHFMAKSFPIFPVGNRFSDFRWPPAIDAVAEIGMLLRIPFNCSGRLILTIDTTAASQLPLSDDWLSNTSYLQREPHGNG